MTPENRIPELDVARGICILAMAAIHFLYDITELYGILPIPLPAVYGLLKSGGCIFFILSGISATLGHRHLRRGLTVFGCGMAVSAVTAATGFLPVRFGVLQSLGTSMLLWIFFQKLPNAALLTASSLSLALGALFERITVSVPFLYPLGLTPKGFESADFFPVFPFFGYFLAGACLGRMFYSARRSLLPNMSFSSPAPRFLGFCGRHSLLIYLIHQPILIFAIELVAH